MPALWDTDLDRLMVTETTNSLLEELLWDHTERYYTLREPWDHTERYSTLREPFYHFAAAMAIQAVLTQRRKTR